MSECRVVALIPARSGSTRIKDKNIMPLAGERSPDIEWVSYTLKRLKDEGRTYDCFSILRPTNPFRTPDTIRRAWEAFLSAKGIDSLRAVEPCKQHPGKMWVREGALIRPLLDQKDPGTPWHSTPYHALPEVYAQNASLEIAWTRLVLTRHSIAGESILPFFSRGHEGFDINDAADWREAEFLLRRGVKLPAVTKKPCHA